MIQFFRNLLGLGNSKPVNLLEKKQKKTIYNPTPTANDIDYDNVFPLLISEKTNEFNIDNALVSVFHEREGNYSRIIETQALLDETQLDTDGEPAISHIKTENETIIKKMIKSSEKNIEKLKTALIFWNPTDTKYKFKILSAGMSTFSSELILSEKHMNQAHKMLNSKELFVSIPRRGLIFICDRNIENEHVATFVGLHSHIVLDNTSDLDLLCEDIFVLENGKIEAVWEQKKLSNILMENS
jgi:hypothetical protein